MCLVCKKKAGKKVESGKFVQQFKDGTEFSRLKMLTGSIQPRHPPNVGSFFYRLFD